MVIGRQKGLDLMGPAPAVAETVLRKEPLDPFKAGRGSELMPNSSKKCPRPSDRDYKKATRHWPANRKHNSTPCKMPSQRKLDHGPSAPRRDATTYEQANMKTMAEDRGAEILASIRLRRPWCGHERTKRLAIKMDSLAKHPLRAVGGMYNAR